jgi:uncharacterized membrane protein
MKVKKSGEFLIIVIGIFLITASNALGINIESLKISSDIQGENVYSDYIYHISNTEIISCLKEFESYIPLNSKIFYLKDEYGNLEYEQKENSLKIILGKCPEIGEMKIIFLKVRSKEIDQLEKGIERYVFEFYPSQTINNFEHLIKLPGDLKKESIKEIRPLIESENYEGRIVYHWKEENVSNSIIHIIKFKKEKGKIIKIILKLLSITLVVGSFFLITSYLKKKNWQKRIQKTIRILNEKDKEIINEIIKKEGINQSELKNKLELSKSNISKIISKLELRELIIKKNEGKINKLYIGEKLRKP